DLQETLPCQRLAQSHLFWARRGNIVVPSKESFGRRIFKAGSEIHVADRGKRFAVEMRTCECRAIDASAVRSIEVEESGARPPDIAGNGRQQRGSAHRVAAIGLP